MKARMVAEGPRARHSAKIERVHVCNPPALKILAIDTSTDYCSVALKLDGETHVRETRAGQNHSSLLLSMIDELLRGCGIQLEGLDAIAYGEGPGSFTGLRITCGVVQGLAFGSDVPVVGVSTLLAMAAGTRSQRVLCCVDARIHEIYHAAYERVEATALQPEAEGLPDASAITAGWKTVHEPSLCAPAEAPALHGRGWLGCGSGFDAYRPTLETRYAGELAEIEPGRYPHARDIAALAALRVERGDVCAAESAAPLYLRDKVALRIDERPNR